MRVGTSGFRGEAPRVSAVRLGEGQAVGAVCAKLLSGDLEAWADLQAVSGLAKAGPITALYAMAGSWLQWNDALPVNAAAGPVPGDGNRTTLLDGGGYAGPQITFLDWATNAHWQGAAVAGAFPYKTAALGIAAPVAAPTVSSSGGPTGSTQTFSFDGSSLTGFGNSDYDNGAGSYRHWSVQAGAGFRPGSAAWQCTFAQVANNALYSTADFGLDTAAGWSAAVDAQSVNDGGGHGPDLWLCFCATYDGYISMNGPRVVLSAEAGQFLLFDGTSTVQSVTLPVSLGTYYRLAVSAVAAKSNGLAGFTVTATVAASAAPGTVLATVGGFVPYSGSQVACNVGHQDSPGDGNVANFCGLSLVVSQPAASVTPVFTNYVYTLVQDLVDSGGAVMLEQESAPSPASTVVQVDNGQVNTVTVPAPAVVPTKIRIYRAVSGSSATTYLLVREAVPGAYPYSFVDSALSSTLAQALVTAGFDPPPAGLRGLTALPNGIVAGFFDNTLALSAQNYPYAWPVENRYATSAPIVALGAIDTTVLILTQGHPYTAYGDTPDAFVLSREEFSIGCVSARSVAFRRGLGIVYACAEGIAAYAGQGQIQMLTRNLFTREQWQALNPASVLGVVHDDRYFFWYDNGSAKGGYVLDAGSDRGAEGFGLVELDFHATAAFVDPLTDTLYLCLDSGTVAGAAPASNQLLAWDGAAGLRPYAWTSGVALLPAPVTFQVCELRAEDYGDVNLQVWVDGVSVFAQAVASEQVFVLPPRLGTRVQWALSGTSRVHSVQLAESVEELS